jgi:hypothetical protein
MSTTRPRPGEIRRTWFLRRKANFRSSDHSLTYSISLPSILNSKYRYEVLPTTSFPDQTFQMTSNSSAVPSPELLSSLLSSLVGSLLPTSTAAISDSLESVPSSLLASVTSDISSLTKAPPTLTSSTLSQTSVSAPNSF